MKRLISKYRTIDLMYVWEVVRSDLIEILSTQHKGHEGAKKIQAKIASISQEVQHKFIEIYIDYTLSNYATQYYEWRIKYLGIKGVTSDYDFEEKIEFFNQKIKLYNQILYKELKPLAVSLLNKISPASRTRLFYGNVKLLEDAKKNVENTSENEE